MKIEHFRQLHIGTYQNEYQLGRNLANLRLSLGGPAPDGSWPHHHWTAKGECEDRINNREYPEAAWNLGYLDRLQPRFFPASTSVATGDDGPGQAPLNFRDWRTR